MKNKVFLLTILLFLVLVTCGTVAAANNTTERISISTGGNQSNGESCNPSISADGRYVTFTSYASNLVPGDNNGVYDIFVRDRVLGITTRISINNLVGESNGDSSEPAISSDGRFIVFSSYATNLVANDNNDKLSLIHI